MHSKFFTPFNKMIVKKVLKDALLIDGKKVILPAVLWCDGSDHIMGWTRGYTLDDFLVATAIRPLPDLVLIGTGKTLTPDKKLKEYFEKFGLLSEFHTNRDCAALFNMLRSKDSRSLMAFFYSNKCTAL